MPYHKLSGIITSQGETYSTLVINTSIETDQLMFQLIIPLEYRQDIILYVSFYFNINQIHSIIRLLLMGVIFKSSDAIITFSNVTCFIASILLDKWLLRF